jgi:acyl carrier protein
MDDADDDDFDAFDEDQHAALTAIRRLGEVVTRIPWFSRIGLPLDDEERDLAQRYLDMLGFPDAAPVTVGDWTEAGDAADSIDLNSEGWEVEEQLRADLSREALEWFDEDTLSDTLDYVTQTAGPVVVETIASAASLWPIEDDAVIEAATGAAVQACYQAALVLAAQAVEEHPFALRFRLFELGRWPVGLSGRSFNIF